jgi:hypothetical protein
MRKRQERRLVYMTNRDVLRTGLVLWEQKGKKELEISIDLTKDCNIWP